MEVACVENAMVFDYWTSVVAHEEPEISCTDPNIPIENQCTDDELHVGWPVGSADYKNERHACVELDIVPTVCQ